uniref:Uncharacterized protein n=1 Tax=Meloidogyne enterolobii TaxID=390850 RepID=A0A6V7TTA9_MELEN|nr:unnamed protein product [Meloidogyne enterolobii]
MPLPTEYSLDRCFKENQEYVAINQHLVELNFPSFFENFLNYSDNQTFILDFNPLEIMEKISNHFDEFGWPEDERLLIGENNNNLTSVNFLSKNVNWILEIVTPNKEIIEDPQHDFGHKTDKEMVKTVNLLEKYANCVSTFNNKPIITLTGPIFTILAENKKETKLKGIVKSYPFNKNLKQPPITQFYKVIVIEYEIKKYCVDVIFTEAKLEGD